MLNLFFPPWDLFQVLLKKSIVALVLVEYLYIFVILSIYRFFSVGIIVEQTNYFSAIAYFDMPIHVICQLLRLQNTCTSQHDVLKIELI